MMTWQFSFEGIIPSAPKISTSLTEFLQYFTELEYPIDWSQRVTYKRVVTSEF